jgi:hypothetical protein
MRLAAFPETRHVSTAYVADILAKAPPMSWQQRDRLQVLLALIHNARQQLRTGNTSSTGSASSLGSLGSTGPTLAENPPACSHRVADTRPSWWSYPAHCSNYHDWKPGGVVVTWHPCVDYPAAVANGLGHLQVSCRTPGCTSSWYRPAHSPD